MQEAEVIMHRKPIKHMDLLLQHVKKECVDGCKFKICWACSICIVEPVASVHELLIKGRRKFSAPQFQVIGGRP